MEQNKKIFHFYEILLALSGLFMLASVFIVYNFEEFTVWTVAKIFYGVGVLLFTWYA